jgi:hypothetical protein
MRLDATESKAGCVLRKRQRGLSSMEACCKSWNIDITEGKTPALCFSYRIRPPESLLALHGRNIPMLNSVQHLGVIFDKKITWRLHIETVDQGTQNIRYISRSKATH